MRASACSRAPRCRLSAEELHRLASKTRGRMGAAPGSKASCHSDVAAPDGAQALQGELVPLRAARDGAVIEPAAGT